MKINQAFILAAGYGTRMRPITYEIPKPMVPVNSKSIISRTMDSLIAHGVEIIIINAFYKKELLSQHIKEYSAQHRNIEIKIIEEHELLETGGGIINAMQYLDNKPFFVANSDSIFIGSNVFTDLNEKWDDSMNALFLLSNPKLSHGYLGKGDFSLDNKNQLTLPNKISYPFPGVHITQPKIFAGMEPRPIKVMKIYDSYIKDSTYQNFYGSIYQGKWFHVDTPESLESTNMILEDLE